MIVTSRLNGFPYQLLETNISATGRSVFAGAADMGADGTSRLSQTEFYAIAAQKEQDSIDLYTSCLEKQIMRLSGNCFLIWLARKNSILLYLMNLRRSYGRRMSGKKMQSLAIARNTE